MSYAYPRPDGGWGSVVGSERMLQFAKHLPAHGIDVSILTHRGRVPLPAAQHDVLAAVDVMRWVAESLSSLSRAHASRPSQEPHAPHTTPREGWSLSDLRTRARRWVLPDRASFAWGPTAIATAIRQLERDPPQLVLSSSPPFAAHVVASALAAHFGVPWIADVRDGYAFEAPEGPSPVSPVRRWLERQLYARAARLITVTDSLRDDFRRSLPLPAAHVITLTNGYDREIFGAQSSKHTPPITAWTILYTGSTKFRSGLDLANLLRGVDHFGEQAQVPVCARLMGLFSADEIPASVHTQVELTGWRPRDEVVRNMLAADVLVVLTGNHSSVATTKLFEYIGAGRPILVVGKNSAAARIVLENGLGVTADDDPQSIAQALHMLHAAREAWRERLSSDAAQRERVAFSRQGQAATLAEHIHALIG